MFKNGWVRLTIVIWAAWVLWSLSERNWAPWEMCSGDMPWAALCWAWEVFLPPLLALGLWWVVRAFGADKVQKAVSNGKAPVVGVLLLVLALGYLATRVSALHHEVESAQGDLDTIKSSVENVESEVETAQGDLHSIKSSVESVESEVAYLRR